ncbi:hypothetical protein [Niveispirillum cyanobacteriorum]|uniref:Uncharacterized protein n=1 Tax=Niveispirillum cyanobacteriorum TaxID=1612173 RepID=A0A2K9NFQ6_9PROT|nr:hypothetical protein [Niveispirillum cyanobacteriorum]AUN31931.1 hypothetical protein C0V82_15990 [Niveispirillum cyanobacteriorum]GGE85665.1 hypothetical protein GCM10011317_48570 [Niveispirillum cyanobacteriorum]
MTWKEIRRRLGEAASLASCALNVAVGTGHRKLTLSAGTWQLHRQGAARARFLLLLIEGINKPFTRPDHCRRAWIKHIPILVMEGIDIGDGSGK